MLYIESWKDYSLIDSGDGRKLERYGAYILDRPEPQAIWSRRLPVAEWAKAHAIFDKGEGGIGKWQNR